MKAQNSLTRRRFLQTGLAGSAAVAVARYHTSADAAVTKPPVGDPYRGLKVGITSYTLHKLSLDDALVATKAAGVKYFSIKDLHLPLKSTPAERLAAKAKIAGAGLTLLGGGVIYIKNQPDEIQNVFEYARDLGLPTIVCSPDPEALDAIERLAKQYDVRIAIHNHGPGDKRYPSPLDVMAMVKNRDVRMGICMDVGHTVRIQQDPIAVMKQCSRRLYDFHLKDVTAAEAQGKATELGKGVINIVALVKTLQKMKWPYHLALEYEANANTPIPGMMECYAYLRGVMDAQG